MLYFLSCNFMSCHLVHHFRALQIGPSVLCLSFSVNSSYFVVLLTPLNCEQTTGNPVYMVVIFSTYECCNEEGTKDSVTML